MGLHHPVQRRADQLEIPAELKRERTPEADAKVQQHVAASKKWRSIEDFESDEAKLRQIADKAVAENPVTVVPPKGRKRDEPEVQIAKNAKPPAKNPIVGKGEVGKCHVRQSHFVLEVLPAYVLQETPVARAKLQLVR